VVLMAGMFLLLRSQIPTPTSNEEVARAAETLTNISFLPWLGLSAIVALRVFAAYDSLILHKARRSGHWLVTIGSGLAFAFGMSCYLYMAVAGMSNPPMQWGYPRTVEGFFHAFTRGQYEKISPTNGTGEGLDWFFSLGTTYSKQVLMYLDGLDNEFNLVCILIAIGVFLFYRQMQKRERSWIIGVVGIFICLGPMLVFLLNPPPDRQARELIRVFFTASHVLVSLAVGYGMALLAASLATHYQAFRRAGIILGIVAVDLALYSLAVETYSQFTDPAVAGTNLFMNGLVKVVFVLLTCASLGLAAFQLMRSSEADKSNLKPILVLTGIGLVCLIISVVLFHGSILTNTQLALSGFAKFGAIVSANAEIGTDAPAMIAFAKVIAVLIAAACIFFADRQKQASERSIFRVVAGTLMSLSFGLTLIIVMGEKISLGGVVTFVRTLFVAFEPGQFAMPVLANLLLLGLTLLFVAGLVLWKNRAPLALTLAIFAAVPLQSGMSHWADNEQRGHLFGYWFGHDMFTPPFKDKDGKPIYPEMTRDAILYGGTDPGRFCPTYMVFAESFISPDCKPLDPKFDRRDVYVITQNALADGTYLNYIRAHYHRSAQKARGLDTPFFQELVRSSAERDKNWTTNILARAVSPLDRFFTGIGETIEKGRRVGSSFFTEKDFLDVNAFAARLREPTNAIAKQLADALSPETRRLLAGGNATALSRALAKELNQVIEQGLYDDKSMATNVAARWNAIFEWEAIQGEKARATQLGPLGLQRVEAAETQVKQRLANLEGELAKQAEQVQSQLRNAGVPITPQLAAFILEAPQSFTRIRLNRQLIEAAFPNEIAISLGGVYPDREMYIASPQDSQQCFQEYLGDAQRRLHHDEQSPNEPRQIRPGEDVKIVENRVQVSGQVAVMAINGLLTKVMFDKNPTNEFFVEESFPLDWMYPHLTPFGVIMKINRQPLPSLPEEVFEKDHEFWSQYSERLIGNWITYDTPVSNIVSFVEKVYLRHDWSGLTAGQRMFARDDQGQKAFSKLRSSIGGLYAWRINPISPPPPAYRPRNEAEVRRIYKEADFTFRQAFAFCPYSPEAVFRYINLLIQPPPPIAPRIADALLVAETALKLDPYNVQIAGLISNLRDWKQRSVDQGGLQKLEAEVRANPTNFQAALSLAVNYLQAQQFERGLAILDGIVANPRVEAGAIMTVADLYKQLNNLPKLEATMARMVELLPANAEAWYDLGALRSGLGRTADSLTAISNAIMISTARRATNPAAIDLLAEARKDGRLNPLRNLPEFQKLIAP
jgi:thioredoxin-like negative regulator of GroEL